VSDERRRRIDEIGWDHSIELEPGLGTPGRDDTAARLAQYGLPERLDGRSVLDVGAWDGFFSFEAERRGAARVVAADSHVWNMPGGRDGFDLSREILGSKVEACNVDVLDLSPETVGTFDVVLFLGVLYHMRHPLLALERVASVTGDLLVLETHVDLSLTRRPAAAFYPGYDLELDPSNWWGPNPPAVVAMLRAVGFDDVEIVSPDGLGYRLARAARRVPRYAAFVARHRARPAEHPLQGRVIVHARRQGAT